jgi:hypothetical protein
VGVVPGEAAEEIFVLDSGRRAASARGPDRPSPGRPSSSSAIATESREPPTASDAPCGDDTAYNPEEWRVWSWPDASSAAASATVWFPFRLFDYYR